jgi:branched-chain amino acid aminotransferase
VGLKVEKRPVLVSELNDFEEVGACGTAAVITPIKKIFDPDENKTYTYGDGQNAGPITTSLYEELLGIQYGEKEDNFGWITILD